MQMDDRGEVESAAEKLLRVFPIEEALKEYDERPEEYEAVEKFLAASDEKTDETRILQMISDSQARERTRRRFNLIRCIRQYYQATP